MHAYFLRGVETRFIGRGSPGGFNASYSTGTPRVAKRGTICRNCRKSPTRDHRKVRRRGGVRRGSINATILRPIAPRKTEYVRKKPSPNLGISCTWQPL